jgi:hypothetical protein
MFYNWHHLEWLYWLNGYIEFLVGANQSGNTALLPNASC